MFGLLSFREVNLETPFGKTSGMSMNQLVYLYLSSVNFSTIAVPPLKRIVSWHYLLFLQLLFNFICLNVVYVYMYI